MASRSSRIVRTVNAPAQDIISMPSDFPPAETPAPASPAPVTPVTPVAPDYSVSGFDESFLEVDAEMTALYAELGGDNYQSGKVTIMARDPKGKWGWLDSMEVPEFVSRGIKELAGYGPGDYSIVVYEPGSRGAKYRKQITITEAAGLREKRRREAAEAANRVPAVSVPANGELVEIREMLKMLMGVIAQQATKPAQENPLKQMREMAEVMRMLNPAPATPAPGPLDSIRMMRELAGLAQELNPPTEGTAGTMHALTGFLDKFGGPLLGILGQAAGNVPRLPQAAPAGPVAPPARAVPDNVDAAPNEGNDMHMLAQVKLKAGIGMLVNCAMQDFDPSSYAGMILDQVPAAVLDEWLSAPDVLGKLAQIDPRVANHPRWFEELLSAIMQLRADESQAPAA